MEHWGCESPCCDYCIYYIDHGTGSPKRSGFAGYGHCAIDYEETEAWMGCDEYFVCSICQTEIIEHWGCV